RRARSLDVGVGAARAQPHEGAVGEVDDRPERLIELVRELGPHLAHGTDAQHVRELLLMAPRAFLGALALGHVFDHGEDVRELAVLVAHDGERFMRPYRIAVAPDVSFVDQQLGALAGAQLPEGAAAAHAIGLGGQLVECLLLQLFGRISQHRAQGAVGIAHTTVAVGGHDPDRRRLEDGAEALLAGAQLGAARLHALLELGVQALDFLLGAFAFGDVLSDGDDPDRPPVTIDPRDVPQQLAAYAGAGAHALLHGADRRPGEQHGA